MILPMMCYSRVRVVSWRTGMRDCNAGSAPRNVWACSPRKADANDDGVYSQVGRYCGSTFPRRSPFRLSGTPCRRSALRRSRMGAIPGRNNWSTVIPKKSAMQSKSFSAIPRCPLRILLAQAPWCRQKKAMSAAVTPRDRRSALMFCTSRYEACMVMGMMGIAAKERGRGTVYESGAARAIPRTSTLEFAWFCTGPENPLRMGRLPARVQM